MNRFILFFFTFSILGVMSSKFQAQEKVENLNALLMNKEWKLFNSSALELDSTIIFSIEAFDQGDKQQRQWGYFIEFSDSLFQTKYAAPCGIDCFTKISGTYSIIDHSKIKLVVQSITRNKYCEKTSDYQNRFVGVFELYKNNAIYEFRRVG